jgi:hypothetical protein
MDILQMSPVLKSSVIFIAQHLLELAPTAAGQLCSLQTCLIEKVAQVRCTRCAVLPLLCWALAVSSWCGVLWCDMQLYHRALAVSTGMNSLLW